MLKRYLRKRHTLRKLDAFDLLPGSLLTDKHEVVEQLGKDWEGEVYLEKEILAAIEHAFGAIRP